MEKAVRTHVGTFKHNDGVNKLQAEFSRNFQAFMEGALQFWILSVQPVLIMPKQAGLVSAEQGGCMCTARRAIPYSLSIPTHSGLATHCSRTYVSSHISHVLL